MLLIPRGPGVETKPIKTAYSAAAGTAYITFDNVKVPVENTLGEVNQGLKVILSNFNHERWAIVANAVQGQRNIVDAALRCVEPQCHLHRGALPDILTSRGHPPDGHPSVRHLASLSSSLPSCVPSKFQLCTVPA
jgi:alkylation response protein AidB-like acyl-CoA dehydrogenase